MNILITGGAGFIGSHLSKKLFAQGHKITILDNLLEKIHGRDKNSSLLNSIINKVNFVYGDVRDAKLLKKIIKDQEVVVHLAAETGTGQSMYEIQKYSDNNINGTACLLEVLVNQKHAINKVILSSSRAVYGEGKYNCKDHGVVFPDNRKQNDLLSGDFNVKCPICKTSVECLPTDEKAEIKPLSIYAITKYAQEQLISLTSKSINISSIILRYQNVYGPGQSLSNPYTGILSIFSTNLINEKGINIFEDGEETRDFVYIDDVVDATILAMGKKLKGNIIYNVGSGKRCSIKEVAELLKSKYDSKSNLNISGNFRLGDIRHNFADLTRIKKELNFKPKIKFTEGLDKFVAWVKQQKIKENGYEKSLQVMKDKNLFK